MKLAIVTGVSRGLGQSVAEYLFAEGCHVMGVSRNDYELHDEAVKHGMQYTHYKCDLGNLIEVNQLCDKISDVLSKQNPTKLYLVNNAAVLYPIDQAMNINNEDLAYHVQVNTTAPMVLMNHCLHESTEQDIPFSGVTITSGAAERPVYGWSAYCSTKASINMYTKTVAHEQEYSQTGHHVIAFSPGTMDTQMQEEIRQSTKEQFVDVESFRQQKRDDQLHDPVQVGEVLVNILTGSKIQNGEIYYVTDFL